MVEVSMELQKIVLQEIRPLGRMSKRNLHWMQIISDPSQFIMQQSHPDQFSSISDNVSSETAMQRQIYNNEKTWLDMELPICLTPVLCRIDLIGKDESGFILTELKRKANPDSVACLSALLQVIAYYQIIKQNCAVLDDYKVHHISSRNSNWTWSEAVENVRLQVRANKEFWENMPQNTKYSTAVRNIINRLSDTLIVELIDEDGDIIYSPKSA